MAYIDSYYSRTSEPGIQARALQEQIDTTVCIVGGGLAGISTALGLVERRVSCVLLESQQVGWGASGRNGGFVGRGFSQSALKLTKTVGESHAKRLYSLTGQACELIQHRIKGHEDSIRQPGTGSVTASWFDDESGVKHYVEEMNRIFNESLEFWPRGKIAENYLTTRYYDGFLKPDTMRFHSLNYALHMARLAMEKGARIFEGTPAEKIGRKGSRWHIVTPSGVVNADQIVYACSGYIGSLHGKLSRATLPVATFILLTEPLGDRLRDAIRSPYAAADNRFSSNYYRVVGDKQILWGGRVSMFHPAQERLRVIMVNDLLSVYPQLKGIVGEVAWGGVMGYAKHKMPQIGQLKPGEWYCQGFGGTGMATTTMGGELIASAIAAGDDQYQVFAPFGLNYVGKPFGPVIAQLAYWSYQLQDALQVSRLNRKF
ncbi:MAG: FAD-binding oxidoreductase [Gammaproteobacteria bacterium]|nr:FAD-binding oxidoreductase [Gammaproteobacteria bacterium]